MTDAASRKATPLFSGLMTYFPAALDGVARVSVVGNKQHNGDAELFDNRALSNDDADCLLRHLRDAYVGDGIDRSGSRPVPHVDKVAWRALRVSQKWHEERGASVAPAARYPDGVISHSLAAAYNRGIIPPDADSVGQPRGKTASSQWQGGENGFTTAPESRQWLNLPGEDAE